MNIPLLANKRLLQLPLSERRYIFGRRDLTESQKNNQLENFITFLRNESVPDERSGWATFKIFDISGNKLGEYSYRSDNTDRGVNKSKFNSDLVLRHKGMPGCYIRYENRNKKKYRNYSEIVIDDETIAVTLSQNEPSKIIALSFSKM